jgi:hypothetical protein
MRRAARRALGSVFLVAAAAVLALEVIVLAHIIGRFGPVGWLVAAIVLCVWTMFVSPFLMTGVQLLWGDRPRPGAIHLGFVPRPVLARAPASAPTAWPPAERAAPPALRPRATWTSMPSTMAQTWPTWPADADGVTAPPARRSAPVPSPPVSTPYGLRFVPMAAVVSMAVVVTGLYLVLAPQ